MRQTYTAQLLISPVTLTHMQTDIYIYIYILARLKLLISCVLGWPEVNRCGPAVWRQCVGQRSDPRESLHTQQQTKGQAGRKGSAFFNIKGTVKWRQIHHCVMKSSFWTAAEEGRGFYCGHKSSNAAGRAADIRGGEEGQQQRQTTDRYTHTHTQANQTFLHQSYAGG